MIEINTSTELAPLILVVDDEPAILELSTELLQSVGCRCLRAYSHYEARKLLSEGKAFDAVLMDYNMPEGTAEALVPVVREHQPQTSLIGTSANDRRAEFEALGASSFLRKPWDCADMLSAIQTAGSQKRRPPLACVETLPSHAALSERARQRDSSGDGPPHLQKMAA